MSDHFRDNENRESFLRRLYTPPGSVIFSEEEAARIELAYDLAKYAHRAQGRKDGTRYFEHPRRVALWVLDGAELYDADAVMAALLHDAYEDSPQYVTPAKIRIVCGPTVERMIRLLSKVPKEGYVERLLAHADWKTLLVKAVDRYDNMSSLEAAPIDFQRKQTIETRDVYLPVFGRLRAIVPAERRQAVTNVLDRIDGSVMKWSQALGLEG